MDNEIKKLQELAGITSSAKLTEAASGELAELQQLAGIRPITEAKETDEDYIEKPKDKKPDEDNGEKDEEVEVEVDVEVEEMADLPPGPALPDMPLSPEEPECMWDDEFAPVDNPASIGVPVGDEGLPTGEVSFQIQPYSDGDHDLDYDGFELEDLLIGEDYDFQNGYDEQKKVDDDEYFPSGATSNVKKKKGPWPAQADNKLFVEESTKIRKRLIEEYKKFKSS